jgi:anti-sigma regulatory factor (Ser/Thr protein kinase)
MRDRLTVRVHSGAVHELQGFVAAFAFEQGLAADDKARILIVIEELFTNLSRYGYPSQSEPEGVAEVTLELEGNQLTIEFGDDGQAFDPFVSAAPDLDQPVETRPVGGLGLHIVRELADEAHYSRRNGRNIIRLSRRVSLLKRS